MCFLKEKFEDFEMFKRFKVVVEKQCWGPLLSLRTDRGGEFISQELELFWRDLGIQRQLTASYTPQQNRVAEGKNRTVIVAARSMLKDKNLPNCFWTEAVAVDMYVLNRFPTHAVKGRTPYEAWNGSQM